MAKLLLIAWDANEAEAGASFAQVLGLPFDVLCLTGSCPVNLGAERGFEAGLNETPVADAFVSGISELARDYSHVAAVSSMASKDALARLAGKLDAAMVTDAIGLESPTIFHRPVVAGSIVARVEVLGSPVMITFRPANFQKPTFTGSTPVGSFVWTGTGRARRTGRSARGGSRPDLSQAKVVVSGGRPLGDAATFEKVIGGLADALGGACGATRAAVDSGIAANELQVGQTGKIVAPDLYIAAGISGSTQHMAGIKDSKIIVAINKDPDAPIFEFADLGLVADLFEAIPAIRTAIGK